MTHPGFGQASVEGLQEILEETRKERDALLAEVAALRHEVEVQRRQVWVRDEFESGELNRAERDLAEARALLGRFEACCTSGVHDEKVWVAFHGSIEPYVLLDDVRAFLRRDEGKR